MKKLKYIKLFEAFDSEKLSKTLSYIKDKEMFISRIKKICDIYDYPYSKLSDDFFDYLPFSKALKKADDIDDVPCDATSIDEFGESGIEGEKCESGKLKRKWGARERLVVCPVCNGTGIKPKKPGSVKMFKFWFTKDGELVGITGVDGMVRNTTKKMSDDINDYIVGDVVSKIKLKSLQTGTYIKLNYTNNWGRLIEDLICYIINENGSIYGIQNSETTKSHLQWLSTPSKHNNWGSIAKYSVRLENENVSNIKMLIPKEVSIDPYDLNVGVDIGHSISVNNRISVKDLIKDAHFSIILDIAKLKKSDYKRTSLQRKERSDAKSGAISLLSDEEVRNINISKYLEKISKSIKITDDIKNASKLIKRVLGFRKALFIIIREDSGLYRNIDYMISYYYKLLSSGSGSDARDTNYYTNRLLDRTNSNIKYLDSNIREIKKSIKDSHPKELELISKLEDLSEIIFNKISKMQIETIEDLVVVNQKILSYINIVTSDNYELRKVYSFISELTYSYPDSALDELINRYNIQDNIDNILKDIDIIKKIIEKI